MHFYKLHRTEQIQRIMRHSTLMTHAEISANLEGDLLKDYKRIIYQQNDYTRNLLSAAILPELTWPSCGYDLYRTIREIVTDLACTPLCYDMWLYDIWGVILILDNFPEVILQNETPMYPDKIAVIYLNDILKECVDDIDKAAAVASTTSAEVPAEIAAVEEPQWQPRHTMASLLAGFLAISALRTFTQRQ